MSEPTDPSEPSRGMSPGTEPTDQPIRRQPRPCTCPHGERSLGRLYGVNMGRGQVRLSTTPDCPEHDSCHGFTKAVRAANPNGSWWWCPKHANRDCPVSLPS